MVTKNMVTFVEIIIFLKFWSQTSYNIAVYVVWRFVVFSLHGWATASFMRWNIGGSLETKYKSSIYVCYNTFHCHKNVIKSSAPFMVTLGASLDKKRTKKLLIKKKKKKEKVLSSLTTYEILEDNFICFVADLFKSYKAANWKRCDHKILIVPCLIVWGLPRFSDRVNRNWNSGILLQMRMFFLGYPLPMSYKNQLVKFCVAAPTWFYMGFVCDIQGNWIEAKISLINFLFPSSCCC